MFTYASLFSGIGGFDLGFDNAGMACVAQCEFDKDAASVLSHHWPNINRYGDVRHVGKQQLGTVELICGGFPCQDVSVAGRRAGLAGERSGLWFEFLRIITECTPRWVVIENVPGLLSSNGGRDFATVIHGLVKCGYGVGWRVLDAQYFGLAQRRKRVFIVAGLTAAGANPAEILFERDGSAWNPPPSRSAGQGATNGIESGTGTYNRQRSDEYKSGASASTITASDYKSATDLVAYNVTFCDANGQRQDRPNGGLYVNETDYANTLTEGGVGQTLVALTGWDYQGRNVYSSAGVSPALAAGGNSRYASGGVHVNILVPDTVDTTGHQGDRVVSPDGVWPTLSAESSNNGGGANALAFAPIAFQPGASHYDGMPTLVDYTPTMRTSPLAGQQAAYGVRRLTPTECERLQGFPDGHTAVNEQSDSKRYKQLGNAVAVNVSQWLGQRIVEAEWRRVWNAEAA